MVLLVAAHAVARPGGGESYGGSSGGGGGGGGSGGSSDDGNLVVVLIEFLFSDLPWPLKLFLIVVVIVIFVVVKASQAKMKGWSSAASDPAYTAPPAPATGSARRRLESLRRWDPDFSTVLFEDFLGALYAHVHYSLAGRIDRLSAYLSPEVLARMRTVHVAEVRTVIVGAIRIVDVRGLDASSPRVEVVVEIESNVARVAAPAQAERTFYLHERWTLARRREARSRPPARARILACPGCGAPLDGVVAGTCGHCRRVVSGGDFDWVVRSAAVLQSDERGPMLTTEVAERGNDLPTVVDPAASAGFGGLQRKDPNVTWASFEGRIGLVFSEFQAAWTARDLLRMRPYFTAALFDTQRFWIEAYRAQGLRNMTDNARTNRIELARVSSDRWFDAVTVRLWATGLDYVVRDSDGEVVRGSKRRERPYSEYWTFVRSATRAAPTRTRPECPSCGAPLAVEMAGDCRYCRANVTTGEFDWVLSRIEQDEAYAG